MSDFHFGYDNDLWVYPPLDDDYEMAEWLEAVEIDGQLFVDADDAITQVRAFQAENAKLRELVSVVYGYYASGTINPCDICDSIGCQYVGEAESGCRYRDHFDSAEAADDEIQRRMRELGIEC